MKKIKMYKDMMDFHYNFKLKDKKFVYIDEVYFIKGSYQQLDLTVQHHYESRYNKMVVYSEGDRFTGFKVKLVNDMYD